MIPAITEVNFPSYATLHQATVSLSEMGDRTITTQIRIDGDIVPDFSGWELEFKGERFILPIKEPQAAKDNTTRNSLIDLTFYSWATYQMKRYFFAEMTSISSGTAIADKYKASVALNLEDFVVAFNKVLRYYFGNQIRMDLYMSGQGQYSTTPSFIEINYTHIWDVLQKVYETYNVRWTISYSIADSQYVIKVGYPSDAIDDHDFEYGYQGGLVRFERQVQDDNITNILLGRGGEKNLPYRYFKKEDAQNPGWSADPDAIPELANIYFDRLRDINFRWYVRGWMQNPNRDHSWEQEGYVYPTYSNIPSEHQFAYDKGRTDNAFDPVEYVKDDESIEKYGERWGALEDNDEIYPSIQEVEIDGIGRVDEVVAVSDILTDDIYAMSKEAATEYDVAGVTQMHNIDAGETLTVDVMGVDFTVPDQKTANLSMVGEWVGKPNAGWARSTGSHRGYTGISEDDPVNSLVFVDTTRSEVRVYRKSDDTQVPASGLQPGTYYYKLHVVVDASALTTEVYAGIQYIYGSNGMRLTLSDADSNAWKPTFDIWVKNIWQTEQGQGETDQQYASRVWEPILGDRVGNEAKIVFSDGFMSISEDYEFTIASYPVVDRTRTINDVPSEWKITLYKSDAEFNVTGLYLPNTTTGGKPIAGDHFFFTGIDMPHFYVLWAEQKLNSYKADNLDGVADINPTWVIQLDKVRVHTLEEADYGTKLADRLATGALVRTRDVRFTRGNVLQLYVQSITYTWNEPTSDNPYLVPDIEVVLSDKVVSVQSPVALLQGDVQVIKSTFVKTADLESAVRKVASPLFLKKTGESDASSSPTTFSSKVSSDDFLQGDIGGRGWGAYLDDNGKAVYEVDKLVVREELRVNSIIANQISYQGGKQIISAASIECTKVVETDDSYICYFDQKKSATENLFVVGDFAMGQVFVPDNSEERYYKMLVTAVDVDSITLSKSVIDGTSAPEEGDVIVQYGSINPSRQYVIIRDVIGGGYERMLDGLSTVNSVGNEYYFAGRQTGSTPRWFVGNHDGEYAQYQNGILDIKGRISVRKTDGTYQSMSNYIDSVNTLTQNLQEQIDGQIQSWAGDVAPLPDEDGGTANYPANAWSDDATRLKHMGDIYVNNTTGQGYRYTRAANDGDFYWVRITDEEVAEAITKANQALTQIQGYQYLKTALADGSTIVEGGLVLTNLIQLGKEESEQFQVYSGINGLMDTTAKGNGIAAWYGGPMGDKEDGAVSWAKSLFRFDGSGYLASGNIGWNADGSGHIPGITWNGNNITIAGDVQLGSVSGDTVTSMINLLRQINEWFGEDSDGNIYVKSNKGFYSNSFISAFGQSDTGGGGGGGLIARVYGTSGFGGTYSDTDYTNTFNAYAINTLYDRIVALEGASVNISVNVTGSGNAVTTGSYNNGVITLTKGATFLTSVAFADLTAHPTTLAGYGITDAKIQNGVITLGGNTITPMTSIGTGSVTNAMLANSAITINGTSTSLGGSFATADITAGTAGTSEATSGLSIAIPYVTLNKYGIVTAYGTHTHSISKANITSAIGSTTYAPYNSAGYLPLSGGTMTGDIKMTTGEYIQSEGGYAMCGLSSAGNFYSGPGYEVSAAFLFRSGNINLTHRRFTTSQSAYNDYTVWDGANSNLSTVNWAAKNLTAAGTLAVTGASTLTGLLTANGGITVASSKSITLGNGVLTWDAQNSAWKLTGNLYATGFISAFGASDTGGGGGGIDLNAMWANLQVNDSDTTGYNLQINPGHLTTALGTYVNAITTTGSGNAITAVSKSGSTLTFTKGSSFALASRTVTGTGYLTGGGALSANRTIDIASTYKGYIDEGHTAYGWGDHSQAGYLTGITSSMVTTALGFTPANSTALGNYLPLTGGQMTGPLTWENSTALPESTAANFFLVIDSFANGGTTKWVSLANVKTSLGLSNYLPLSGGAMANTNKVTNLNADLLDGLDSTDFTRKFSYTLGTASSVNISFAAVYHAIIIARNTNNSEPLILIGGGYGDTSIRNRFKQINTTSSPIHWRYHSGEGVQIINNGVSNATVSVLVTYGTAPTFTAATFDIETTFEDYVLETVNGAASKYLPLSGGTMTGNLNLNYGSNLNVKFDVDTSRARVGLRFLNTADENIGQILMHNTAKSIYINATGAASIYDDAVGKYSLRIGQDRLTYNTYDIWHAGNANLSTVNWSCKLLTANFGMVAGGSTSGAYLGTASGGLGSTYTGGLILAYGNNPLYFYTNSGNRMMITGGGNVGIGTTTPAYKLDVAGVIHASSNVTAGGNITATGYISSASYVNSLGLKFPTNANRTSINATGWYRVWTGGARDTFPTSIILNITKNYGNSASEGYLIEIGLAGNGQVTFNQISGTTQTTTRNITKIRYVYVYNTAAPSTYIDIYYSGSAQNSVQISGLSGHGTFSAPTAVSDTTGYSTIEFETMRFAQKTSRNIVAMGYISAFGVSSTSDARLKKDFRDTTLTVDDIAHAPAITFLWKDREGKRQAGSLAQYWETVLPEVVTDIEGKKGLDYGAAALVSAITIARDVNDHEKRIRELERENRELKRRLGYAME